MNLYFSVSFHQPFPLVSKWAVMVIQALPKTFHCEIRIQLICGGLWLPLPNMGPNKKVLLHILILTDHKPVTDGFNTTINGNFKKCLWILSPADDGAFTIRNGSAKSAQMHIFIKQFRCPSCSAFSFILICKAWLQTQLPRFYGDSAVAPHSYPGVFTGVIVCILHKVEKRLMHALIPRIWNIALFFWRVCSLGNNLGEVFPVISQTFSKSQQI